MEDQEEQIPNNPLGDDFGGAFDDGTGVYYNIIQLHQIGTEVFIR